ncbi:hypothetical protein B0H14DRAFT_3464892 [Mycena olivaceomarginata]|nr:hypothetical protein B0H14DRAFT_3464892 [Mycena olivaceomarginata]
MEGRTSPFLVRVPADKKLGFKLESSMTDTYWSTHETMIKLADYIIAPYFEKKKAFLKEMKEKYPNIIIIFVPGGCTGIWQPLDDIVDEATALLKPKEGEDEVDYRPIKLDTTIGTLRNRCIGWLVDAFHAVNKKEIILKSFELCAVGQFNFSQASLTSPAALAALRDLPNTNPALHLELTGASKPTEDVIEERVFEEEEEDCYNDESDVPVDVMISHVIPRVTEDGSLIRNGAAEDPEIDVAADDLPLSVRRGKRSGKKKHIVQWGRLGGL